MSPLWTPYVTDEPDEEILDLSKSNATSSVKTEPLSAAPSPSPPPTPPQASPPVPYGYYIPATLEPTLPPMEYYLNQIAFQYGHPPPPQISPSSSSGFAEETYHRSQQPSTSPPASEPESLPYNYDSEYLDNNPEYIVFERDALRAMAEKNGGRLVSDNPRMRRAVRSSREEADAGYRQQRERNNAAAKQSRDRRKLREVKLALKVSFLEKQTRKLQAIIASGMCSKCFPRHPLY